MAYREAIRDHFLEHQLYSQRASLAGIFVIVMVLLLAMRMVYLQIIYHDHFITESQNNRIRLMALPPPRGLIYDRNGVLLAENQPSYRLEIIPEQVRDIEHTLQQLSTVIDISDTDIKRFRKELKGKQAFQNIPLRFNLSDEEVARFAVNRHQFPGVDIAARLSRRYPHADLTAHTLGYVGRIDDRELQRLDSTDYSGTTHTGKLGVERYYEELLHGKIGYQQVEVNAQGRTLRILKQQPPVPGRDLILTIDLELQEVARNALGNFNGAVVAMDPATGEILAMLSLPTYDPNLFVSGMSVQDYVRLRDDPERPLFNRALAGQYPPGSTIKPLIGLAGLHYGVTTARQKIHAGGYYMLPNDPRKYRGWKIGGHGIVNLKDSITQSCDVYFYDLSYRLGIDRIHEFLTGFGLGARSALDSTGEASGLLPSREWKRKNRNQRWYPGETVISGIGQGYMLTTPLQLAMFTSVMANRGYRPRPHLLLQTRDSKSNDVHVVGSQIAHAVKVRRKVYWDQIIQAMTDVVHKPNGTAYRIGLNSKYKIAGKTGTAQVFGLKEDEKYDESKIARHLRDHSLFVAFAPADDPKIAVAVLVENGGHGSTTAAPVARKVMDHYLLKSL